MIFGEPPEILQEFAISINMNTLGCNSYKKSDFSNLRVATLTFMFMIPLILRTSRGFRMS